MFTKSGLFLFSLVVFQVSARYKAEEPTNNENEINPEYLRVSPPSSRIGLGWDAQPGQFPYHAALRTVNPQGSIWRCGGSIVAKEWVITSGQCIQSLSSVTIRVGLSFNSPDAFYPGQEWYNHPNFNNQSWGNQPNDIALVKSRSPIVFTDLVKPIRLQRSADAYRNYEGEQVYISGHGRIGPQGHAIPDMLRWVYLLVISSNECARSFPNGIVVDTMICARYYNETTQSPCHGDAGGPLVHDDSDGVPTLIGVWSITWGASDCFLGTPTGYTRPGPYLPWFKEVTGIDFDNSQEEDETTAEPTTSTSTEPTTITSTEPTTITTAEPITTTEPTTTDEPITTTTDEPTTTAAEPSTTTTAETTTTTAEPSTTTAEPTSTESGEQLPEDTTPEGDATTPSEGSGEEDDSDQDDDMTQLMKRLQVLVKVKVRMNKYKSVKAVGMEAEHQKY